MWLQPWNYKISAPWNNTCVKPREHIKKQRQHFSDKGPSSQSCGVSSNQVQMWELNHKEGWEPKNWCFKTVVLEKTLETALDIKEIKPVNAKGNISWIFIGGTEAEAEALILWPSDAKSQLNGKDPDAGKDWEQEEKRAKDDEMVGWHHRLNGHEFEQTPGDCKGQGSLSCCSAWDRKQLAATEWLINKKWSVKPWFSCTWYKTPCYSTSSRFLNKSTIGKR